MLFNARKSGKVARQETLLASERARLDRGIARCLKRPMDEAEQRMRVGLDHELHERAVLKYRRAMDAAETDLHKQLAAALWPDVHRVAQSLEAGENNNLA